MYIPSKAEDDTWMMHVGSFYEYIARYVYSIEIVLKNPAAELETFTIEHNLKLQRSGPISQHFGDMEGTPCIAERSTSISKLTRVSTCLEPNQHTRQILHWK